MGENESKNVRVTLSLTVVGEVEVEMTKEEWEALDERLDERGYKNLTSEQISALGLNLPPLAGLLVQVDDAELT